MAKIQRHPAFALLRAAFLAGGDGVGKAWKKVMAENPDFNALRKQHPASFRKARGHAARAVPLPSPHTTLPAPTVWRRRRWRRRRRRQWLW